MSRLKVYSDTDHQTPIYDVADGAEIAQLLREINVSFERWQAAVPLAADATQDDIIAAYQADVDRLKNQFGYQAVDVLRVTKDTPNRTAVRQKFLQEHTHDEDEIRFFVEGSGIFYLHINNRVYATLCERNDLIAVPHGISHWFDMGENPNITSIRLFTNVGGWMPQFTGAAISDKFPTFEKYHSADVTFKNVAAIVMDIEGTTGSLSFVKETLFPFAAAKLPGFIASHATRPEVAAQLDAVRRMENNLALSNDDIVKILLQWVRDDNKATPLKALQGMIWQDGYKDQAFHGHVYEDALETIERWHVADIPLYIYSSGSIAAQRLLFGHTAQGDITGWLSGYFDTTTGPKRDVASYQKIAAEVGQPAETILFLSDIPEELAAARDAGLQTLLIKRPESPAAYSWPMTAANFRAIRIEGVTNAAAA